MAINAFTLKMGFFIFKTLYEVLFFFIENSIKPVVNKILLSQYPNNNLNKKNIIITVVLFYDQNIYKKSFLKVQNRF